MAKKNGANAAPQTENQVVENEALTPEVSPEVPVVADPAQAPEVSVIGAADAADPVEPVINEEEGVNEGDIESGEPYDGPTPTKEEVDEFFGTHLDEEVKEAPLTDEDILKKVAEAAHTESGSIQRWEDLHEESKKSLIRAAKYFRDNPEAHADQWYGVLRSEHPELAFYYDLPETTRNAEEAFAASVKNAYKA